MAVCVPNAFDILAGRDVYRRASPVVDRSAVYFGSRKSTNDRRCHAANRDEEKKRRRDNKQYVKELKAL